MRVDRGSTVTASWLALLSIVFVTHLAPYKAKSVPVFIVYDYDDLQGEKVARDQSLDEDYPAASQGRVLKEISLSNLPIDPYVDMDLIGEGQDVTPFAGEFLGIACTL